MPDPTIVPAKLDSAQQACVDLLEEALAEAKRGNIHSLALVVCMGDGIAEVMAGTRAGDLNLGCDRIKRKILDAIEEGNVAKPSRIIKVGR